MRALDVPPESVGWHCEWILLMVSFDPPSFTNNQVATLDPACRVERRKHSVPLIRKTQNADKGCSSKGMENRHHYFHDACSFRIFTEL
jgi:hypothetical protein